MVICISAKKLRHQQLYRAFLDIRMSYELRKIRDKVDLPVLPYVKEKRLRALRCIDNLAYGNAIMHHAQAVEVGNIYLAFFKLGCIRAVYHNLRT